MHWLTKTLVQGSAVILIAVVLYIAFFEVYPAFFPPAPTTITQPAATAEGTPTTGLIYGLAVDMEANGLITQRSVLRGDDSLLAIKSSAKSLQDKVPVGQDELYVFNGVKSFIEHIKNFDGTLTEANPFFNELQLVNFKRHHSDFRIKSLTEAGIRAIVFSPAYVNLLAQGQQPDPDMILAYVVMGDSSQRLIKLIPLPEQAFARQ